MTQDQKEARRVATARASGMGEDGSDGGTADGVLASLLGLVRTCSTRRASKSALTRRGEMLLRLLTLLAFLVSSSFARQTRSALRCVYLLTPLVSGSPSRPLALIFSLRSTTTDGLCSKKAVSGMHVFRQLARPRALCRSLALCRTQEVHGSVPNHHAAACRW